MVKHLTSRKDTKASKETKIYRQDTKRGVYSSHAFEVHGLIFHRDEVSLTSAGVSFVFQEGGNHIHFSYYQKNYKKQTQKASFIIQLIFLC